MTSLHTREVISISEAKELAQKRPASDPIRAIILASDDNLTPQDFASLVKLVLKLMKAEGEAGPISTGFPKPVILEGSKSV